MDKFKMCVTCNDLMDHRVYSVYQPVHQRGEVLSARRRGHARRDERAAGVRAIFGAGSGAGHPGGERLAGV